MKISFSQNFPKFSHLLIFFWIKLPHSLKNFQKDTQHHPHTRQSNILLLWENLKGDPSHRSFSMIKSQCRGELKKFWVWSLQYPGQKKELQSTNRQGSPTDTRLRLLTLTRSHSEVWFLWDSIVYLCTPRPSLISSSETSQEWPAGHCITMLTVGRLFSHPNPCDSHLQQLGLGELRGHTGGLTAPWHSHLTGSWGGDLSSPASPDINERPLHLGSSRDQIGF